MTMTLGEMLRAKLMMADLRDAMEKPKAQEVQPAPAPAPEPEPIPKHHFAITNNLNRTLFAHIKNSPGSRADITSAMVSQGFKMGSVSAVIGQMLRQGLLQADDEGLLHTTTPEYVPIKGHRTLARMKRLEEQAAKRAAAKAKREERKKVVFVSKKTGLPFEKKRPVSSSVVPAAVPMGIPPGIPSTQALLRDMSLLQARELYDELRKLFGGDR